MRRLWRPRPRARGAVDARLDRIDAALAELTSVFDTHGAWLSDLQEGAYDAVRLGGDTVRTHDAWLSDLQEGAYDAARLGEAVRGQAERMGTLERWIAACVQQLSQLGEQPLPGAATTTVAPNALGMVNRQLAVWTLMSYIALDDVPADTSVSVILPTWQHTDLVRQAVASVLAQRHTTFELLIVVRDDDEPTRQVVAEFEDDRIRLVPVTRPGAPAARNAGLKAAAGPLIAYLDDDNVMHPGWLRSVVWAFDRWPDVELLYGARILEDPGALGAQASGELPSLDFPAYSRRRLERSNFIDQNVIAHRAGIPDGIYDETLTAGAEWDFCLRLLQRTDPRPLPALACLYRTLVPNRLSDEGGRLPVLRDIRERALARRPLRVLVYSEMYPVISETYIREEAEALRDAGAEIFFAALRDAVSRQPDDPPDRVPLEEAMERFDPDVVLMPWATHAVVEKDRVAAYGRPFAVWVHSFDFDPDIIQSLAEHTHCIGVWAFPHHATHLPGSHALVPVVGEQALALIPPPPVRRDDVVIVVTAGLGKKDWPTVLEAFDRLPDMERVVITGRTVDFEMLPAELAERIAALRHPFELRVNVARKDVLRELGRASTLLYTLEPDRPFGMPMSIIEGMLAGACIIAPEREEARLLVGEHLRTYVTVDDIVDHVQRIRAGGVAIEQARTELRARAVRMFTGPGTGRRFLAELRAAHQAWFAAQG
jgi:hypothetical protein